MFLYVNILLFCLYLSNQNLYKLKTNCKFHNFLKREEGKDMDYTTEQKKIILDHCGKKTIDTTRTSNYLKKEFFRTINFIMFKMGEFFYEHDILPMSVVEDMFAKEFIHNPSKKKYVADIILMEVFDYDKSTKLFTLPELLKEQLKNPVVQTEQRTQEPNVPSEPEQPDNNNYSHEKDDIITTNSQSPN